MRCVANRASGRAVAWLLASCALLTSCSRAASRDVVDRDHDGFAPSMSIQSLEQDLAPGATGEPVRAVQAYLAKYGYLVNPQLAKLYPSWAPVVREKPKPGHFAEVTTDAVRALQRDLGQPQTGTVDAALREQMKRARCSLPAGLTALRVGAGEKMPKKKLTWRVVGGDELNVGEGALVQAIKGALRKWSVASGLSFEQVESSADLTVRADTVDGTGGALSLSGFPSAGATVTIDKEELWSIDYRLNTHSLHGVLLHELGHALGLTHSGATSSVMFAGGYPLYREYLTAEDREAIAALYAR